MPALHELGPVPRFFFSRVFPWFIVAIGALALYLGFQTMVGGWASNLVGEFVAAIATLVTLAYLEYQGGFAAHVDLIHAGFRGAA